eukprot:scaffold129332_cov36-Phaeocystis_antarctica.AAC.1
MSTVMGGFEDSPKGEPAASFGVSPAPASVPVAAKADDLSEISPAPAFASDAAAAPASDDFSSFSPPAPDPAPEEAPKDDFDDEWGSAPAPAASPPADF